MAALGVPPPPPGVPPPPSSSGSGSSVGPRMKAVPQRRRMRRKGGSMARKKRMFLDSGDPKVLVQKFGINVPIKKKRKYLKGVDPEFKFARQSSMPDITVPDEITAAGDSGRRSESRVSASAAEEESYDEGVIVEHLVASVWMAKGVVSGMLDPRDRLKAWKNDKKSIQTCNICMEGFTKLENDMISQSVFDYAEMALANSLREDPSGYSAWMLNLDAMSIHDPSTGHSYKYSASLDLRVGLWVAVRVSVITDLTGMEGAFSEDQSSETLSGTIGDFFAGYDMDEDEEDGEEMLTAERSCVLSDLASLFEMECEKEEKTAVLFAEPLADFDCRIGARFFPVWGAILEEYLYADEVIEEGQATSDEDSADDRGEEEC